MNRVRQTAILSIVLFCSVFILSCGKAKEEAAPAESAAVVDAAKITPGEMVLVPAGEFVFGYSKQPESSPEQKVNLPAYYIDKYEVTMAEFLKFTVETGYQSEGDWRSLWAPEKANMPVVNITWADAAAYAKWANKRLPTEMEWEKAARGDKGFRYPWGDEWQAGRANTYESGIKQPAEIGSYAGDVSPFGTHDMLGNVKEWTGDSFQPYKGTTSKNKDYGPAFRVVRGCDYAYYAGPTQQGQYHLGLRGYYLPNAHFNFGFRCAKDAPAGATK